MTDDLSLLSGYLDGELASAERAVVEARLAESAEWRAELAAVRSAREAVRGLAMREAPVGFWEAVHASVTAVDDVAAGDDPKTVAPLDPGRLGRRRTAATRAVRTARWAGAAAVAAAVIAVFLMPGRTQVRPKMTAVAAQHAAASSDVGDPISGLVAVVAPRGAR